MVFTRWTFFTIYTITRTNATATGAGFFFIRNISEVCTSVVWSFKRK